MSTKKWSVKKRQNIKEVVSTLRTIADQIESSNNITFDDRIVILPESVDTKIKFKIKDKQSKFSIKLYWQEDESGEAATPIVTATAKEKTGIPKKFKEMKKLMNESLITIETNLKNKSSIDKQSAIIFKQTVDDFRNRAKPEWLDSLNELEMLTQNLLENLEKSKLPDALSDIRRIWDLKEKYHTIFK